MSASVARLKHFGWGREGEGLSADEELFVLARAEARFGRALTESASAPPLDEIALAAPRIAAPGSLPFCTSGHYDRAAHTYGKSYPELVRGLARDYASAPDVVAYPRNESDVAAVLDWAGSADATVTPFGGGSSVAGRCRAEALRPQGRGHDRSARDEPPKPITRVFAVKEDAGGRERNGSALACALTAPRWQSRVAAIEI